jgi:ABC-type glycerol-3-phosphate transport system substrate-binding protein
MKSKMLKLICLVLSVVMLFSVVGCGADSGKQSQSGGNGGATKQEGNTNLSWDEVKKLIPADANGKTIEVISWNKLTDVTGAQQVVDKFTKETGINVKWTLFSGGSMADYRTKVVALVSSKQSPDVVRLDNLHLGLLQVLQPLQDINYNFNDSAWDTRIMDVYTFGGKTYGTNMRNTLLQQPRTLIYNKNLISKYDLEDPYTLWKQGNWTLDKFLEICQTFTDECDESSYAWTSYRIADMADIYGASMIKRDGDTFTSNMSDGNLLKGWQKMTSLREEGITNNMRFDLTNFENGKILFFTESPIGVRTTHFYFQSLKSTGALAIVPYPTMEGGNKAAIWSEVEAYGIPQGAPNADLVPYFLRYYLDADNYDKNTFFADKTMLDVYESLMAEEEIYVYYDYALITEDVGRTGEKMCHGIINVKSAQVKSKLDEYAPLVNAAVKNANGIVSDLSK